MPALGSCRICSHTQADAINTELLAPNMNKRSLRGIAALFAVNSETLRRHNHNCLGKVVMQEQAETLQELDISQAMNLKVNQELAARATELSERAQICGSSTQMVIITRELAKLLADLVQDASVG